MYDTHSHILTACNSEQAGAAVLGYTKVSWDNLSGKEKQPWSSFKSWFELSLNEKAAAGLLGYTETTWDNEWGSGPQPASVDKSWAELTACAKSENSMSCTSIVCALPLCLLFLKMLSMCVKNASSCSVVLRVQQK